jgi:hypothetical protein
MPITMALNMNTVTMVRFMGHAARRPAVCVAAQQGQAGGLQGALLGVGQHRMCPGRVYRWYIHGLFMEVSEHSYRNSRCQMMLRCDR